MHCSNINYDEMCRQCECEHYIEWEHPERLDYHTSMITCVSCQLVGQSYNIDEYPSECPFKYELDRYMEIKLEEHRKFMDKMEKDRIWKKLNKV